MINILHGKYRVIAEKCDSKNEMLELLFRCKQGYLITDEPEAHNHYIILKYQLFDDVDWFGIGIYLESFSFPPNIVSHFDDNLFLLGCNNHIFMFNLNTSQIVFNCTLDGDFMFAKYYNNTIIVISELNAVQIDLTGNIINSVIFDNLLESFKIVNNEVICNTIDKQVKLELLSI